MQTKRRISPMCEIQTEAYCLPVSRLTGYTKTGSDAANITAHCIGGSFSILPPMFTNPFFLQLF
jgi:hypothetical protein